MSKLVPPHRGGKLKPLLLEGAALQAETACARALPKVMVSSRECGDLIMLGIGGFTPLDGFMSHTDWKSVCDDLHLANGLFWPIPITLSTSKHAAGSIKPNSDVALVEAHRSGIHPFYITIDREAREYLPRMYGAVNYTVIDDVARLPLKVSGHLPAAHRLILLNLRNWEPTA